MSERDGIETKLGCVGLMILLIIAAIVIIDKVNVAEIRDLQRRVGTLESERR